MSIFVKEIDEYVRTYDIIGQAREDLSLYLSLRAKITMDKAREYVGKVTSTDGIFAHKNPKVAFLHRGDNGDRTEREWTLGEYIDNICKQGLILAPNFTAYIPTKIKRSILAEYILENMALRSKYKKQMFTCRMRLQEEAAAYFKTLQESFKVKNNSVSGMHAAPGTPFYNKSTHSSLTSMCRCATSYANSNNEKFLGGLRHYYNPNIAIFHVLTAVQSTDLNNVEECFAAFGVHQPTADECMQACLRSTRNYWYNEYFENEIRSLFECMTTAQRAAWLYTGDLYHLDKYNPKLVGGLLTELIEMKEGTHPDPETCIKGLDDNYTAIATLLCAPLITGIQLKDALEKRPEAYHAVALTAENMKRVCERYRLVIETLLRSEYLPHSIATFPTSIRMSVPTSDTDSTIFTTAHFVDLYGGDVPFSHQANSIQYAVTFLISGLTQHTLMMYSSNLGVDRGMLPMLEMKNEFIFPVYVLTALAKHYFSLITAGEGNVYLESKRKLEVKGVNLRSSNAAPEVTAKAEEYMRWIINSIMENKKFKLADILDPVYELEMEIINDLKSGGFKYMTRGRINDSKSYSREEEEPNYKAHLFWNKYLGEKYGLAPTLPYRTVKVKVNLENKRAINDWIESIDDVNIKKAMVEWVADSQQNKVSSFKVPLDIARDQGLPKEILPIVNIRAIVTEVMKPFYIVLESLGVYMVNKRNTRILSDEYTPATQGEMQQAA